MKSDPCQDCGRCCMSQESPPMYVVYLPGAAFENDDCADARRVRKMPQEPILRAFKDLAARIGQLHDTVTSAQAP